MNGLVPAGYITLREAVAMIERALTEGRPEDPRSRELRGDGLDVCDGTVKRAAGAEFWKAVDRGRIDVWGETGEKTPGQFRITSSASTSIPLLRDPRVLALHYLRPGNPLYREFATWFGPDLGRVVLMVREPDAKRVVVNVRRRRKSGGSRCGRPSLRETVVPIIRDLVDSGKWSSHQSLKSLTALVNRGLRHGHRPISEDTVTRSLDEHYEETGDHRFRRMHRKRR